MHSILSIYIWLAITIFTLLAFLRLKRLAIASIAGHKAEDRNFSAVDCPAPRSYWFAIREALLNPLTNFHLKSNKVWSLGYIMYHIGIILMSSSYAISGVILIMKIFQGAPIPDIEIGTSLSQNYSMVNLMSIIMGNGEPLQAKFLFGGFASAFIWFSWCDILCALTGNLLLMFTQLSKKSGSVTSDFDAATKGLRVNGKISPQHLLVRTIIFSIIILEIIGRLNLFHGALLLHVAAAVTLILFLFFTYLSHIAYLPVALYVIIKKRRNRTFV